jgi:mannose-6-phosphate isomerase-like protein (cupin superfamily)
MEITEEDILRERYHEDRVTDRYREWRDAEGIPVHHDLYYDDRDAVETGEWDRTGQRGAFLNLHGIQGVFDIQLHELVPGGETTTQHHLYEQIVYVSQGRGATEIGTGHDSVVFEWQENSLFFIPQCVPYKHVCYSEDENAHLFAQTTLPELYTMLPYEELVFEPEKNLWEEAADEDFYSVSGDLHHAEGRKDKAVWEANLVPDLVQFDKLKPRAYRGAGTNIGFKMPNTSIWAHAAEFPRGTYKKAHHRVGPASVYTILSGEGYSLMWHEDWDQMGKIDWSPGTIISYPHNALHQHFNTGTEPARYMAWHAPTWGATGEMDMYSSSSDMNQIEYHEEDPVVREYYAEQLEEVGRDLRMPQECYTDPEFQFTEPVA